MTKKDHLNYVLQNPFSFDVPLHGFTEEEVHFLKTWGSWLEGLTNGTLLPVSEEQETCVKEMHSRKEPTLAVTKLWKRYLRRSIEEKDTKGVLNAPPPTLEDDPAGSREDFNKMRRGQFGIISRTHKM
jgi:uncharacterized protein YifE (UPF0438 family)